MNDIDFDEARPGADEAHWLGPAAPAAWSTAPVTEPSGSRRDRRLFWLLAFALLVLFWLTQYSYVTAVRLIRAPEDGLSALAPRAIVSSCGLLISLGILTAQYRLRRRSLGLRAMLALLLGLAGAALHSVVNQQVFTLFFPEEMTSELTWVERLSMLLEPFWLYVALSAIALALNYGYDIREREARIRSLQSLAQAAQLRALRNQLNPHFLFNTLNSITALISRGRSREAEQMTESLADFLRQTLVLDPQRQITLGEEIALQLLYLDIEKARFPDRLNLRIDIPDPLRSALVPSLITQPLIENSVKYAVARSSERVDLEVRAAVVADRLELVVRDDGGNADAAAPKGFRVGLANVTERLGVVYGGAASFEAGPLPHGGFSNVIRLPLRMAES